jgi:endogenous inhibitor of DNA gyrase (YacG/DUF329 family)
MTDDTPIVVECPTCKAPVQWTKDSPWRPFCSERCRLIDLGDWLEERNRIPDEPGDVTDHLSSDT